MTIQTPKTAGNNGEDLDIFGGAVPYYRAPLSKAGAANKARQPKRPVSAEALSSKPSHSYSLANLEDKHMPWGV